MVAPPKVTPVVEAKLGAVSHHTSASLKGVSERMERRKDNESSLLKIASSCRPAFRAAYAVTFPERWISTPSIVPPANCWAISIPKKTGRTLAAWPKKMLQHYSHVRMDAKRNALDALLMKPDLKGTSSDTAEGTTGGYDTNHDTNTRREMERMPQAKS
jgi:hypothetical protein